MTTSDYVQRPEVLESNFYAWRATGDTKYLDRAASAVASFQKYLKVADGGYIGLNDVNDVSGDSANLVDDTAVGPNSSNSCGHQVTDRMQSLSFVELLVR